MHTLFLFLSLEEDGMHLGVLMDAVLHILLFSSRR